MSRAEIAAAYSGPVRYYVQFTAGTGTLMLDALDTQLPELRVRYADDSAMVLETSAAPTKVAGVPFLKNAFAVIAETGRGDLDRGVTQLAKVAEKRPFPKLPGPGGRFRIMVHVDGSLAPVGPKAKSAIERTIGLRTGSRVEPRGQCQEYWVVGRQGMKEYLLGARLPKPQKPAKAKGAISHELSAMLVAASRPTPQDIFLDPFAGTGSFPLARLELPVRQVLYSDLDLIRLRRELPRQLTDGKRVRLLDEDGRTLPSIADGSIDVIVTDPPWGEHEELDQPFPEFAPAIGASFARVLHPGRGRYVLLINRRNAATMSKGLAEAGLAPDDEHEVLVNGHPATVLTGCRPRPQADSHTVKTAVATDGIR
ncbi:MAG: TRM11 family SAM-dependent methyltransferase [Pseudonocardiales bacterium]